MGCCLSKKTSPSGGSCSVKAPDPNKAAIDKPLRLEETEAAKEEIELKTGEEAEEENGKTRKEVFVIKHRKSEEKSKTTDPEESSVSEGSNPNPVDVDVDVDAILIQCGRLSRSNSAAAKTRRYSGSKRSYDFEGDADAEDGGEEEEAERRVHRQRHRGGESPRERRRRTPSREREREDSKSYRSGSRERGNGSRRVSRSPGRRSDTNPNSCAGSVNSGNNNNRPAKFVSVPATDKSNTGEPSTKRITVKRNIGKAASPRSQSPARAAPQPSPSKLSRKTDHSPYRRNPLGEVDQNTNCNKRMMSRENDNVVLQKLNTKTAIPAPVRRSASPIRVTKEAVEETKLVLSSSVTEFHKPQTVSRSRSLRRSRDFDFSPEALLSNNTDAPAALPSYTALLLEDIQNFHQKSINVNAISSSLSKACTIVEAVADLNSSTKQQRQLTFTAKKADLMEPSFEKYVTVKRGGSSLEDMEEQESSGSNSFTGSSGVVQRQGYSMSASWEPNSAESTDRASRSPLGDTQEFDPLKKSGVGVGRKRVALVDSSSGKGVLQAAATARVAAVSM